MNKLKNKILLRNIQNIKNYFNNWFAFLLNWSKMNDREHEYKYSKIE